jgi:hypothetical protein
MFFKCGGSHFEGLWTFPDLCYGGFGCTRHLGFLWSGFESVSKAVGNRVYPQQNGRPSLRHRPEGVVITPLCFWIQGKPAGVEECVAQVQRSNPVGAATRRLGERDDPFRTSKRTRSRRRRISFEVLWVSFSQARKAHCLWRKRRVSSRRF